MRCFSIFILLAGFVSTHIYAKPLACFRMRRNALRDETKLWPNATVLYTLEEDDFSTAQLIVIQKAMNDISAVSCIRFKKRIDERGYVRIFKGDGCFATVGYTGYQQQLSLGSGCYKMSTAIHEIFHTLGFYHEHARPDRDNYITIKEDNVKDDEMHNFDKKTFLDVKTLGLPYDFNSVLQYHDRSFAIDRKKKTLKPNFSDHDIDDADEMSLLDVLKLNLLYGCMDKKP